MYIETCMICNIYALKALWLWKSFWQDVNEPLLCWIYLKKNQHLFAFYCHFSTLNGVNNLIVHYRSCNINVIAADGLMVQQARVSITKILAQMSGNISASAPERLTSYTFIEPFWSKRICMPYKWNENIVTITVPWSLVGWKHKALI